MMNEKKLINQELVKKVKEYLKIMEYPNFKRLSMFKNEDTVTTNSSSPITEAANNDRIINSACLSYRHDFGLMNKKEQDKLRDECKEWMRAINGAKDWL